jgi:hypothetical protein
MHASGLLLVAQHRAIGNKTVVPPDEQFRDHALGG